MSPTNIDSGYELDLEFRTFPSIGGEHDIYLEGYTEEYFRVSRPTNLFAPNPLIDDKITVTVNHVNGLSSVELHSYRQTPETIDLAQEPVLSQLLSPLFKDMVDTTGF